MWAPLVVGAGLSGLIYAGGPISGAHYNPAVSIAFYLRGRLSGQDLWYYLTVQMIGGVLAALVCQALFRDADPLPGTVPAVRIAPALLAEFIGTLALCYVILEVATTRRRAGNNYYGVAIGATVMAGGYAFGTISGAMFNPSVALGSMIVGLAAFGHLWIYLAGTLAGGVAAALIFLRVNREP